MLDAFAPIVVHDADESHPLAAAGSDRPALYGRATPAAAGGTWLQYWLYYPYQDQDRGIVRSGRHEGDWELVQYRVDENRLVEAVYAQHSGQERCGADAVQLRGGRPLVHAAHGSHASYFRAGTRDRMWPDPNDEADGRGTALWPRAVRISESSPAWMRFRGRWGGARAGWFPAEQSSPRGPAFQGLRWDDPAAFARTARTCTARRCVQVGACDGGEAALTGAFGAALLALAVVLARRTAGL